MFTKFVILQDKRIHHIKFMNSVLVLVFNNVSNPQPMCENRGEKSHTSFERVKVAIQIKLK